MKKELIVISVPTTHYCYTTTIGAVIRGLERESDNPKHPYRFTANMIQGYQTVAHARNRLAQLFLENKEASRIWYLDQDVLPPPEIPRLLGVDADIVAGAYPVWKAGGDGRTPGVTFGAYIRNGDGYRVQDMPTDGRIMHVDAVLGGCTIIKRHVLENPKMRYPMDYVYSLTGESGVMEDHEAPAIFRTQYYPNGKMMTTEDIDFCHRAKKLGYSIKLHTGIQCGHLKISNLMDVYEYGQSMGDGVLRGTT